MSIKFIWISILGIILSFIGGFMIANALNRNELDKIQAENTRLQKLDLEQKDVQTKLNITDEEIQIKLKEAEQNPKDFLFQKGLGLALYRYAGSEQDKSLLDKVTILLERAHKINPDDYEVIVSLGNLYYDLGQLNTDPAVNLKARGFYKKALDKNEKDANVLTDHALTFLLTEKPDREIAIKEFEKALEVNPKNEKALTYMTQAQLESGNLEDGNKYLARLKAVNPKNGQISELENLKTQQIK